MGFEYNSKGYKSYHKQYGNISLYLIVRHRELEVNQWGHHTQNVINFVRSNYDKFIIAGSSVYMPLLLNWNTGEMQIETPEVHIDRLRNREKYNLYCEKLIYRKDFDEFFNDIKQIV